MKKMKVATVGIKFDKNKESNVVSINLVKGTEILSVQAENDEYTLWIYFMSPSESFSLHSKREGEEFQFVIHGSTQKPVFIDFVFNEYRFFIFI